ncbi:MAG: hypothetical protein AAF737_08470 [Pseudomonadota bacterium]
MRTAPMIERIRAAQALTIAMADGSKPNAKSLKTLGLSADMARHFKR